MLQQQRDQYSSIDKIMSVLIITQKRVNDKIEMLNVL